MNILVVAATEGEISQLRGIKLVSHKIDFLVTGPGMVATTYTLTRYLQGRKFDLAVNVGLAGTFDRSIEIGQVVDVNTDTLSELGAENDGEFLTLMEIGLDGKDTFHKTGYVNTKTGLLRKVKSITVNTVHGNDSSIEKIIERHKPEIETMEGAAFFYVCEKENIPSIQLRSISNYVEKRNRDAWNIPLALTNLKRSVEKLISEL